MQKSGNYETMKVWTTACILMGHSVKKTHIFKEKHIYLKGSKHVFMHNHTEICDKNKQGQN